MKNARGLKDYMHNKVSDLREKLEKKLEARRAKDPVIVKYTGKHAVTIMVPARLSIHSWNHAVSVTPLDNKIYKGMPEYRELAAAEEVYAKLQAKNRERLEELQKAFELELLLTNNEDARVLLERFLEKMQAVVDSIQSE